VLFLAKEIEKRLADLKRGHLFSPRINTNKHQLDKAENPARLTWIFSALRRLVIGRTGS